MEVTIAPCTNTEDDSYEILLGNGFSVSLQSIFSLSIKITKITQRSQQMLLVDIK